MLVRSPAALANALIAIGGRPAALDERVDVLTVTTQGGDTLADLVAVDVPDDWIRDFARQLLVWMRQDDITNLQLHGRRLDSAPRGRVLPIYDSAGQPSEIYVTEMEALIREEMAPSAEPTAPTGAGSAREITRQMTRQIARLATRSDKAGSSRSERLRHWRRRRLFDRALALEDDLLDRLAGNDPSVAEALFTVAGLSLDLAWRTGNWFAASSTGLKMAAALLQLDEAITDDEKPGAAAIRTRLIAATGDKPDRIAYAGHRAGDAAGGVGAVEMLTSLYLGEHMIDRAIAHMNSHADSGETLDRMIRVGDDIDTVRRGYGALTPESREELLALRQRQLWDEHRTIASADLPVPYLGFTAETAPLTAADVTGRTLLYITAGGTDSGAAIRIRPVAPPGPLAESIELPQFHQGLLAELVEHIRMLNSGEALDVTPVLDSVADTVWRPVLQRWPDLLTTPTALVPIGSAACLPFYTAPVRRDGGIPTPVCSLMNLTIAPSARSLLLAANWPVSAPSIPSSRLSPSAPQVLVAFDQGERIGRPIRVTAKEARMVADVHHVTPLDAGALAVLGPAPATADEPDPRVIARIRVATILHLACHGNLSADQPLDSWLELGSRTRLRDLLAQDLQAGALVVLTACSIGGISTAQPAEQLGFPAALLAKGARAVVGALWPMRDTTSTARLMHDFHTRLANELSPLALGRAIGHAHARGVRPEIWSPLAHFGA